MKWLYLIGEVDASSVKPLIEHLDRLTPSDGPATIQICSAGGDVSAAFALIASMRRAPVAVYTYGVGEVASAALDILAMGTVRGLHPLTMGMTHAADTTGFGKRCAELEDARAVRLYAGNRVVLDNWSFLFSKRKRWHTADQLVKYGFADYLGEPQGF
jgi:ATP-dependent protease ClpP protease subunit